ncbi:MAG TPA: helix-turn-helix domain-containing protein [Burkholderiales bacterium]|nr:helix-turn-helix domain-containing protein [Burkholderiales bacterium]
MSDAVTADVAPGRLLARLRAERKLTVADVAQRLKYAVRQIEALEAEEFSRLPGTTFVRGMVRGYAKLLEIDAEPLLKSLEARQIPGTATVDLRAKRVPFPDGTRRRRGTRLYAVMSALVLVAVGGVLYEWHSGGLPSLPKRSAPAEVADVADAAQSPAATEPAPVTRVQAEKPAPASHEIPKAATSLAQNGAPPAKPAIAAPPAPAPKSASAPAPAAKTASSAAPAPVAKDVKSIAGQGRIVMEFADDSWVEINDGDGKLLMAQLNHAGSRRVVSGHPPFSLVIGNAAAVRVVYNERLVDLVPYVKVEVARFTLP